MIGAFGPINIATAPQPPVGRAGPCVQGQGETIPQCSMVQTLSYTAISAATTIAHLPSHAELSIHAILLNNAAVPP